MKKLMITAAALMIAVAAHGQGQFLFNTRNLNSTPNNNVKFTFNGAPASGADLFVEVLGGTSEATLAPLGTLALNRTGTLAGYTSPLGATFSAPGATVIGYQAFQGTATGFGTATVKSTMLTTTKMFDASGAQVNLSFPTDPTAPPPELVLGVQNVDIGGAATPEPATLALGLIGLGTLLAFRRRS